MKFFLMILTFTPWVFAEGVLAPHVTHVAEPPKDVMDYKPPENSEISYIIEQAKSGVRFPLPPACVKDPFSSECMEIVEKITSLSSHNFSAGDEGAPGFSVMDYPHPTESSSSPLQPQDLGPYDMTVLKFMYQQGEDGLTRAQRATLEKYAQTLGMKHDFSAGADSLSPPADAFTGENTPGLSVMDLLQLHQLGKVVGLPHYEPNEADFEELRKNYRGD